MKLFDEALCYSKYQARNDCKKRVQERLFKAMNNSAFGKTIKNIKNDENIKLLTSQEKYGKYVMK